MLVLSRLTSAIRTLSDNLVALAGTVELANQGLRARLALDHDDDHEPAALDHHEGNGEPAGALPEPRRNRGKRAGAGAE
jgi:hypothetical protein